MARMGVGPGPRIVVGYWMSFLAGYLAGSVFRPNPAWVTVAVLVGYHFYLAWLVIADKPKKSLSLPILSAILTHSACLAVIFVGSGAPYRKFVSNLLVYAREHPSAGIFLGIARYSPCLILVLALWEYGWLFSGSEKAEESHAGSPGEAAKNADIALSPRLRELYLEVVNQIHPDRASSESDLALRERLMKDGNAAFQRGDAGRLRSILEEYKTSSPSYDPIKNEA